MIYKPGDKVLIYTYGLEHDAKIIRKLGPIDIHLANRYVVEILGSFQITAYDFEILRALTVHEIKAAKERRAAQAAVNLSIYQGLGPRLKQKFREAYGGSNEPETAN